MENNFSPNYIKCPGCKNVLDLSFKNSSCPNPLCGFNFAGLDELLSKNDDELQKILLDHYNDRDSHEYKLVITAIKYNSGNYLAHFIECNWGAHYNTLFDTFLVNFFDDLNIFKTILKSEVIKNKDNVVLSKNGYKMFWELYDHLKKLHDPNLRSFLVSEFPVFHRKHYNELYKKHERARKEKIKTRDRENKLF